MPDHLELFGDARIAIVTFAAPERLTAYRDNLQLPFDVVADLDRVLYRMLGAARGTNRQVLSLGTIWTYARLLRAGHSLRRPKKTSINSVLTPSSFVTAPCATSRCRRPR